MRSELISAARWGWMRVCRHVHTWRQIKPRLTGSRASTFYAWHSQPDADTYLSRCTHILTPWIHTDTHIRAHVLYSSPQKTPTARHSGLDVYADLAWQQQIDITLRSLFILSVLGPARFTYSLLHSLAANRLWTSRLSIIQGSLTVLWQPCWIDSSDLLFIFACLASSLLSWDWSLACRNSRSNHPSASSSSYHPTYPCRCGGTTDIDKITGVSCFPPLFSKVICNMTLSYERQPLGQGDVAHTWLLISSTHTYTHTEERSRYVGPVHIYVPAQIFHYLSIHTINQYTQNTQHQLCLSWKKRCWSAANLQAQICFVGLTMPVIWFLHSMHAV